MSTNGDTHLGGDDFDQRIIKWILDNFNKQEGIDLSKDPMAMQRLREAAEKAKIELSGTQTTNINLPFITADASGPRHLNMDLSLAEFNRLTEDLVQRSLKPCSSLWMMPSSQLQTSMKCSSLAAAPASRLWWKQLRSSLAKGQPQREP